MKILITGAKGFIGKNLIYELRNRGYTDILEYDLGSGAELLDKYCKECDFAVHLAGVNRPKDENEFMTGNFDLTSLLLDTLKKHRNRAPILFSSSVWAANGSSPYGKSKKAAEDLIIGYGAETGAETFIYRFPNVFGKWCRPNYNSAVATFCHNIARDIPITISDRSHIINLVYIDDAVNEIIRAAEGGANRSSDGFCYVPEVHTASLGEIADMLFSFRESRSNKIIPDMTEGSLSKKLYSTYLSYLPENNLSYPLDTHTDARGSFTEILRTVSSGQVSVNISKPHITKGNHWHHTKNEKFAVVSGSGVIRLRRPDSSETVEYRVSGDKIVVVDIPPGYTHNIENTGDTDMVTVMWCSECFNPGKPDTYSLEV